MRTNLHILADLYIEAVSAETAAFRATAGMASDTAEAITDLAMDRVLKLQRQLIALPVSADPEYARVLAFAERRWRIMEGDYERENQQIACRMIDAILAGTRFDQVPMLWHIKGDVRDHRPTDEEFQAGWDIKQRAA